VFRDRSKLAVERHATSVRRWDEQRHDDHIAHIDSLEACLPQAIGAVARFGSDFTSVWEEFVDWRFNSAARKFGAAVEMYGATFQPAEEGAGGAVVKWRSYGEMTVVQAADYVLDGLTPQDRQELAP
jgi:hypothetical protein